MQIVQILEDYDIIQAGDEIRETRLRSDYTQYVDDTSHSEMLQFGKVEDRIPYWVGKTVAEYLAGPSPLEVEIVRRAKVLIAENQVEQMRDAIKDVLSQKGDDLCWMDIYTKLGTLVGIEFKPEMLPREEMLTNCRRFVDSLLTGEVYIPLAEPIKMIIFCPECGAKHVDAPGPEGSGWDNPPHKSHLCRECGSVFRVADVETEGVESIGTRGTCDTWPNDKMRLEVSISLHDGGVSIPTVLQHLAHDLSLSHDRVNFKGSAVVTCTDYPEGHPLHKKSKLIM